MRASTVIIRDLLVEVLLEQANRALFQGKRQGDGFSAFTVEDVKLAFENFNRTHGYKGVLGNFSFFHRAISSFFLLFFLSFFLSFFFFLSFPCDITRIND
jgi:hypothetical protein